MWHIAYLSHLQADNLGVCALATGDVTCVAADDLGPLGVTTVVLDAVVSELSLRLCDGDTSDVALVVLVRERGQRTPAAADVENTIRGLEVELWMVLVKRGIRNVGVIDLLADDSKLVILKFLEGFLAGNVGDNTRGVNHTRAKEPMESVNISQCRGKHMCTIHKSRRLLQSKVRETT